MGTEGAWNGLIWLKIRTSDGLVSTREWTLGFHEGEFLEYVWTLLRLLGRVTGIFTSHLILMLHHYLILMLRHYVKAQFLHNCGIYMQRRAFLLPVKTKQRLVCCVASHQVTNVSTSRSTWNLRPPRGCFSPENTRQSFGDELLTRS